MDIATLGIKIENGDVVKATASLEGMAVAGAKTEAATQRVTRRMALLEIEARKMDSTMGRMGPTMTKLTAAFGAFTAIAAVGFIGRETIKNTIEAQNAMAQLDAAVRSTGGAAGRTVSQLDALSMQLQKQTIYSDEAVKGAEAMLLTFDKIRGTEFDRATRAVADLSARMGGDLQAAAVQVGKALQDPEHGLTALRRSGVSFSESQIAVIKNLYETGRVAEGQRVILAELEHQFGGSAAAARDTLGGAIKGLGNAFGDLFEVTRGGAQGTVEAINAITRSIENSGLSMNTFMLNTVIGWNNITAAAQKFNNVMSIDLSKGLSAEIDRVKALNERIDFDRNVEEARLRNPARVGPVTGVVHAATGEQTQAELAAAKRQHEANLDLVRDAEQAADLAGMDAKAQARQRIEYEATNKVIDAQRRLKGALLDETIDAIEKEKQFKIVGLSRSLIREEMDAAKKELDQFADRFADKMGKAVGRIFGAQSPLGAMFDALSSQMFRTWLQRFIQPAMASMAAVRFGAGAGGGTNYLSGLGAQMAAQAAGGALAGGLTGYAVGGLTTSRGVGAISGAMTGAGAGFLAAGPIGAATGALMGFVGGVIGAGGAAREAAKAYEALRQSVALSIEGIKATIAGDSVGVAIAAAKAQFDELRRQIDILYPHTTLPIQAIEDARKKALDEVNDLEAKRIAQLMAEGKAAKEVTTASLNMVQGYKIQAAIFSAMSGRTSGPYAPVSPFAPPTTRSNSGGDLHVTVMVPNGEVLGKSVMKDFASRKQRGDAELARVLS